ncbi:putative cytochrome p450 alkane hydroxylase protein [Botrytis fragariae]|uniref:Putative cytochrome p450 alkane hydroxylase protein n=1 Tax=Botrytis fragariae TaxID=1964551 RepID=A0A8H6EKN9_9HELO|nr:putative cytochrome p450 alkane hydroxylase protein [Botrytis fragariae]KAF5875415.1 putative cytochrome p450 alkane hydroxylase protein [Botrytis fragariae]
MRATTYLFLFTTGVFPTVYLYRKINEHLATVDLERKNGCIKPRKYPHREPILGLDLFFKMGKAMKTVINTCEPRNIQTVLAFSFENFGKVKVKPEKGGGSFEAQGIFTADGPIWQRSRALIRPTFARTEISNFATLEKHVGRFLDLIPRDGSTIDLHPLTKNLFLDISTEFLFGESVESQCSNTPFDSREFLNAFDMTMRGLGARMMLGKLKFICGRDIAWKRAFKKVHAYIDKYVTRVLESQKSAENIETEDKSSAQKRYVLLNEMAKETQDPVDLRYQLFHVFIPAHDATGIAVSDILFHLARDPDRCNKLRTEVLAATTAQQTLSFELLKSMKYLRYVFNESLRLHPTAGFLRRVCHKNTILPLGGGPDGQAPFLVRKGSSITCDIHTLHRDKTYWGVDADDFRPERWEKLLPTWEYLPFSGGPRICPAQQMVFTDSAYIVVRVIQNFSKIENQDPMPWMERFRMTVENKNGVKVKVAVNRMEI